MGKISVRTPFQAIDNILANDDHAYHCLLAYQSVCCLTKVCLLLDKGAFVEISSMFSLFS